MGNLPGGSISHSLVLNASNVDQNLGGGIIHGKRSEDRGSVVRDCHVIITLAHLEGGVMIKFGGSSVNIRGDFNYRLQDFVHALGTESGFDHICNRNCAHKGRQSSIFTLGGCDEQ